MMQVSAHVSLLLQHHMELTDCSSPPKIDERDGVMFGSTSSEHQ